MKNLVFSMLLSIPILCVADATQLGKTHFIVGYEVENKKEIENVKISDGRYTNSSVPYNLICNDQIKAVYFAPNDSIHEVLTYLIDQEKKHIKIAMFTFTDKAIATALITAKKRGVTVELITDASSVYGKYNKLSTLAEGNIKLYVYNPQRVPQAQQGLMHNKFFIFQENILARSLVWTGSFNATGAAGKVNRENVVVTEERIFVDKFLQEFDQLKRYCDQYQLPKAVVVSEQQTSPNVKAEKK